MLAVSPFAYFTDPILRAPTIGCMLMCLSAALVGVIALLRKTSLVGEALSHAAFPGVILGVIAAGEAAAWYGSDFMLPFLTVGGAFVTAMVGLFLINFLESRVKIPADSALCFVLSAFFGVGITLASHVQFVHSALYIQSLSYLYGQAATMVDAHIYIYGALCLVVIGTALMFYKELQVLIFDKDYAKSIGIKTRLIRTLIFFLIVAAIVIGIRSVGVVLMSAMLIAPAVAARQFTHRLSMMMLIAGFFGLVSGYLGVYLSVELTNHFSVLYPTARVVFPTGPMIVMAATAICAAALLFAPERGLLVRMFRVAVFRYRCVCENILKAMWRYGPREHYPYRRIAGFQTINGMYLLFILHRLAKNGWIEKLDGNQYRLTEDGVDRGAHIVRLHRLWELYLADYLGIGAERVHRSAEEMEHIITPEIEHELTELLKDPKFDPHHQPIPPHEGSL